MGAVVYAVWQLLRPGADAALTLRIAPLAVALYIGSSLWLAAAKYGPVWATMPTLAVMAACAVAALLLTTEGAASPGSPERTLCLVVPFALYAGWTVCATFVNVAEVAPRFGFDRFGLSVPAYAILSLGAATAAAAGVIWLTRGDPVFAGTVLWALVAILIAGRQRGADTGVMLTAGGAIAVVVVLTVLTRRILGANGPAAAG
jgi:hypothetical protein